MIASPEEAKSPPVEKNQGHILRLSILGGFVLAIIAMLIFGGSYVAQLEAWVLNSALVWGLWVADNALLYAVGFLFVYALSSALGLPVSVVLSLGGGALASLAFGFWVGTLFSAVLVWIAVVLGSWGLFESVRRFGASSFEALIGPYMERFKKGFAQDQFFYMLASRFTPVPPAVMTVIPALLGANRGLFVLAAAIGFLPGVLVFASLGAKLGELLAAREAGMQLSFSSVVTLSNTWPLLALLALSFIPLIVRRFTRRGASDETN